MLIGLVAMAVVGLLCYQGFVTRDLTGSNLLRAMLILAGLLLALFRGPRKKYLNKADYKAAYGHIIGTAFADDAKLEKKLYAALADFNSRRYPACLNKLEQLRLDSPRSGDRFVVHTFNGLCYDRMERYEDAIALRIADDGVGGGDLGQHIQIHREVPGVEPLLRGVGRRQFGGGGGVLAQGIHGALGQVFLHQQLEGGADQQQRRQQDHRCRTEDTAECCFHWTSNL